MPALVSVVIAVYNQAEYLGYTIQSVLNQSYPNIELIVVDDGSTDATPEVMARFGDRIKAIRQENSERGAARNRGFAASTGEFVAFLDSDDIWLPDKIESEVNVLLDHENVGVVYSDQQLINSAGEFIGYDRKPDRNGAVTKHLLKENFVCLSANLIRRSAFEKVGGFPESRLISGSEDWVLWVKLSTVCQFHHLKQITVLYRIHPRNTMSNAKAMERAMRNACGEIEVLFPQFQRDFPAMRGHKALFNAINFCANDDRQSAWKYLWSAVRIRPFVALDIRFSYTIAKLLVPSVTAQISSYRRDRRRRLSVGRPIALREDPGRRRD